jgi:uncharacterized metal-binding protein YceD (DUF177 family)
MKVKLIDIDPRFSTEITGTEPWLLNIYANFPMPVAGEAPKLSGVIELENVADGSAIRATGKIEYAPVVPCDRCGEPLIWPIDLRLDNYFQPEPDFSGKNRSLSASELEQYYYKDNDFVDLEELINDQLHMNLPSRVTCEHQTGRLCAPELDEESAGDLGRKKPFAVLANLKLDDN